MRVVKLSRGLQIFIAVFAAFLMLGAGRAHAIVVCHDYTLYRVTCSTGRCEDNNNIVATSLRERLTARGYRGFSITNIAMSNLSVAENSLKPGDVIFLRDAHSGFVNDDYRIDHFLQLLGQIGQPRSASQLPRFDPQSSQRGGLFLGDTFEQFLSRPIMQGPLGAVEVWRRTEQTGQALSRADFDMDGTWDATITTEGMGTEKYLWRIKSGLATSTIDWSIASTLLKTTDTNRSALVGQNYKGYVEFRGTDAKWDLAHIQSRGDWEQRGSCVVGRGTMNCDGTQYDMRGRPVKFRLEARKSGGTAQTPAPTSQPPTPNANLPTPPRRMPRYTADQVSTMRERIVYYDALAGQWAQYRDTQVAPYWNNGVYYQWARNEYQRCNQQIQLAQNWSAYYRELLKRAGIQ